MKLRGAEKWKQGMGITSGMGPAEYEENVNLINLLVSAGFHYFYCDIPCVIVTLA